MTANASAQGMPPINLLGAEQKRPLTPKEQEQQKKLDDDYKAATNKIPNQKQKARRLRKRGDESHRYPASV
jgi:hypothetical protein